ncbi:2-amino-4-hydroxy-6-hydroxymethyldihydropteridine diphosphokinase [Colwellia sp. RSH04]|uniref:2-amino-4-hydroxy-6- hydroxymethyldihydropteridine diphosphokinase n=1 Tax=Colwellia sp. RSH04 TaxID=2305464 RepID=UPI000E58D3E8|nr:2-amino-4-hydroxy-6-hydroxymethyldihydropteridine diphosphokinase [Colwellia sp. RSH04]RHW76816.1 2-amino-4-hydroxy-6-hydroxymethyldihydropteridine diphosphokinase [Colwellia sp. RSH04]
MAHIYISVGSNINREHYINLGLQAIADAFNINFSQLILSSLFESEAVGFAGAPFYNMVVGLQCSHSIEQVTEILRDIEFSHGRKKDAQKYSPRTLDLDILLYDDLIIETPAQIPRHEICTNAFVLWPLSEIAPTLYHPILKQSYQELWQQYDKESQQLNIVNNCW